MTLRKSLLSVVGLFITFAITVVLVAPAQARTLSCASVVTPEDIRG